MSLSVQYIGGKRWKSSLFIVFMSKILIRYILPLGTLGNIHKKNVVKIIFMNYDFKHVIKLQICVTSNVVTMRSNWFSVN